MTCLIVTEACCCAAVPNALGDAIPQGHELAVPLNEVPGLLRAPEQVLMNSVAGTIVDLPLSALFSLCSSTETVSVAAQVVFLEQKSPAFQLSVRHVLEI